MVKLFICYLVWSLLKVDKAAFENGSYKRGKQTPITITKTVIFWSTQSLPTKLSLKLLLPEIAYIGAHGVSAFVTKWRQNIYNECKRRKQLQNKKKTTKKTAFWSHFYVASVALNGFVLAGAQSNRGAKMSARENKTASNAG